MEKIIIVNNNLKIGGIQKSLINMLNSIKDKYDITLYLFNLNGEYIEYLPKNIKIITSKSAMISLGISLEECKKVGLKCYIFKIICNIITKIFGNNVAINFACVFEKKITGYDVAISYMQCSPRKMFYGGTNEFVLKKVVADKKISFVHCDFERYGGDYKYAQKIYQKFDKIAFCSIGCMNTFLSLFPNFTTKSMVVYNFTDTFQILRLANDNSVKYSKKEKNIVVIGRISYDKGIDIELKIIKRYIDEVNSNIHIYFIGYGDYIEQAKNIVNQFGINNYVTFCGNQKNVYRYMKNADLLLHLSRHEAAPMVFDEANVLKLPILSSNTTSAKELVEERNIGLVGIDEDDILEKLSKLLNYGIDKSKIICKSNEESIKQFDNLIQL